MCRISWLAEDLLAIKEGCQGVWCWLPCLVNYYELNLKTKIKCITVHGYSIAESSDTVWIGILILLCSGYILVIKWLWSFCIVCCNGTVMIQPYVNMELHLTKWNKTCRKYCFSSFFKASYVGTVDCFGRVRLCSFVLAIVLMLFVVHIQVAAIVLMWKTFCWL